MAKSKKEIKKPTVKNPQYEKLQRENERRKQRNQKYKMPKRTKRKIKAIIAATIAGIGAINVIKEVAVQAKGEEITDSGKIYTIAQVSSKTEETPVINVDGEYFEIDKDSFAIVEGEIEEGKENYTLAYDEAGNIRRGNVSSEYLQEISKKTKEEMERYNTIYQVTPEVGANVRATATIEDDNIISTVAGGEFVLGYSTETVEYDGEMIQTLSTNGDNLYQGYIREDLIQPVKVLSKEDVQEQDEGLTKMVVDTSKVDGVDLRIRTSTVENTSRNIMTTIPNGSIVYAIGDTVTEGERNWTEVKYKNENGYEYEGWVATEYLKEYTNQEKEPQEDGYNITLNADGKVTGIDVSSISPEKLRQLLQDGIPKNVSTTYGDVNTSKLAGKINYVIIKLGASPYGNGEFKPIKNENCKALVEVCEEMGVAYTLYYYSGATNRGEGDKEADFIIQEQEKLKEECNGMKNYKGMVVDVELAGENDRHRNVEKEEVSQAKAHVVNRIQEAGISENVLLYAPGRVMDPKSSDQILDLEEFRENLYNPDKVDLWLCAPILNNGRTANSTEYYIDLAKEYGFNTVGTQVALDVELTGRIDINSFNLDYCEKVFGEVKITEPEIDNPIVNLVEELQTGEDR